MGLLRDYYNLKTGCLLQLPLFRLSDQLCCTRWNEFTQEVDKGVFPTQAGTGVRALCTGMLCVCWPTRSWITAMGLACSSLCLLGGAKPVFSSLPERSDHQGKPLNSELLHDCPVEFPSAKEKQVSCDQSIISPKLLIFHWCTRCSI